MKKQDVTVYTELIEKVCSKHTTKLEKITILGIHTGYSYEHKRSYTYYTYKCNAGQYYPAANKIGLNDYPLFLDGLVGTIKLSELKRRFTFLKYK